MGIGLYRAYSNLLLLISYNAAEESALWSPNWDPKAYNLLKKIPFMQGGAPFVFFFLDFVKICQSFPLFYRKPAKNSQQILVECVQKHFKSALEKLPNFAKNLYVTTEWKN